MGSKSPQWVVKAPFHWCPSIFDVYIIVSRPYVEFGEEFCSLEFVKEVGYQREGVSIVDCVFV